VKNEFHKHGERLTYLLALLTGISTTILVFATKDFLVSHAELGYMSAFVGSLLSAATGLVGIPFPAMILVYSLGSKLNPVLLGVIAGTGSAVGEMPGYLTGFGMRPMVTQWKLYKYIKAWMDNRGLLVVFWAAAIPNPIFDLASIAAGVARLPASQVFVTILLGRIVRMLIVALLGRYIVLSN